MEAQEQARRKSDAKKAVMSRLDVLNKNRDERYAYSKALAEEVCAKCESGCFNECMNEKGEWCGDAEAVKQLEALCARAQEQMDEETADKKRRVMSWNSINLREDGKPENNLDSLMDWVSKP